MVIPQNNACFLSAGTGPEKDLSLINLQVTGKILPPAGAFFEACLLLALPFLLIWFYIRILRMPVL